MSTEEIQELWGEDLFKVFAGALNEEGWLTSDWNEIIEEEIPRLDEDYNDNPKYADTYQRMHMMDFEDSEDGKMIRPV